MAQIMKYHIPEFAKGLVAIIILLSVWDTVAYLIQNNYVLPQTMDILMVLFHPFEEIIGGETLIENTLVSLKEVISGFTCAAAIAIPLGLFIGWSSEAGKYLNPVIQILRPVPPIAWMPFAIAWFGIGFNSVLFIIVIGAFFPILINTVEGVKGIRRRWIEVAEMLHATPFEEIRTVVIPGALPVIWTGLRVSFGVAWMCVVAAEMLPGTSAGLGFLIMYAYNLGQLQVIGAGMVIIGVIGLGADTLFKAGQARFFGWQGKE
ncbi:ABC transporter permease [Methanoplanus endosymbiosus]|uniref:ABC transporter permease n=1 Tax=Methanoplanus endosymbiosus TaxID=33865 RepID=A0A9E7PLT7_9EURY|nr:ABC transporter permease [Methanoplanus endosymbiosus]UUX91196.1 ABC transporter permease [Methanoplanus endosymbiosus]